MSAELLQRTLDPALRSWVDVAADGDFPIQNLPLGAFLRRGDADARLGVAIGRSILDLRLVARAGLLDGVLPDALEVLSGPTLNPLLQRGRASWTALRIRLSELLRSGNRELHDAGLVERGLISQAEAQMVLPFVVADYVDFYSSLEHATNVGKILRPGADPLLPNWRWLPIGYHGRAATIVVDGTPIVRPRGQTKAAEASAPTFGASRMLDIELELGYVTGDGPALGESIPIERAPEHIFGVVLLNDWSARDIQAWEYQPLGPFLGKSFATSISPWVVTLDALEPFRVSGPRQEPAPLPYLAGAARQAYDVALEIGLSSSRMRAAGMPAATISRTNFRGMYWSMAQQLTHLSSNGSRVRAGDLCGSGTVSGPTPESYGSLLELTWRGARPIALPDGTTRAFLADGDEVTLRGWCAAQGHARIGLGSVRGAIVAHA